MKILVVTNMYPTAEHPSFGCFVKSQVESLEKKGIAIDVIFVNGRASRLNYLKGMWQVFWKSLNHRYNLVHAHYGLSGLVARCQTRSPVVVSFCGSDVMDRVQGRISRLIATLVDLSIAKSERLGWALGKKDVRIIPNGFDPSLFRPMDRHQARETLGLSQGTHYILFPGDPANRVKRVDLARQTLQIVTDRLDVPVELLILFGHPQHQGPLYMNACDVMLLTSDWEGSPNVVKEAMACNMPIVSTDVGDVREITRGTRNCCVCPQEPSVLAEKIATILENGERSEGRGKVSHLSLENIADQLIAIYQQLIRRRGHSHRE
jgi:teichuronic acid biosynthesis glycosyltransferase TuaC